MDKQGQECIYLYWSAIMNWSDVAEAEELSEPEFIHPADTACSSSSGIFLVSSSVLDLAHTTSELNPYRYDYSEH